MKRIYLYDSLIKRKVVFKTKTAGKVRMYHCGPTVYKEPHLGNMRRFLFADFLRRTLELFGYEVQEITNITDVGHLTRDDIDAGEDKIAREAKMKKTTPEDIANSVTQEFFDDLKALNIQFSHKYPRATDHINAMQEMIRLLIEKGYAYQTKGGVYYDVGKFKKYGQLSGNTAANLNAGNRVCIKEEKRNPADFALWINDESALQKWPSPWGVGYPGWHIECSAMSTKYLGSEIDIHTGGEDNKFPHHENEIAQSEAALGKKFVRYWLHNSHLLTKGAKLAKSTGEQLTLDTLINKGYSPLVFRVLVFSSHYRSKQSLSWEALDAARENLQSIKQVLYKLKNKRSNGNQAAAADFAVTQPFKEALADDLNTPAAWAIVMRYVKRVNAGGENEAEALATFRELDKVLGVMGALEDEIEAEKIPGTISDLTAKREEARGEGDYAKADELRSLIESKGYLVEDTDEGPWIKKR